MIETFWPDIWRDMLSPGAFVGHLAYVLLVLSMMMRTMVWLRVIAIAAGLASVAYGWIWLRDPLVVIWEALFTLTNLVQLAILAYQRRQRALDEHERVLVDTVLPGADMDQVRRLLDQGMVRQELPETVLLQQGVAPAELLLLTRGTVQIMRDGVMIGACGEGDFLGEISFQNGGVATADVVVTNAAHLIAFKVDTLRAFLARNPDIAAALQIAIGRNVAGKLDRTSHAVATPAQ